HDPAPAKEARGSGATRAGAASPRAATASSGRAGRPATPARQTLPARPGNAERSATGARPSAAARPASADAGAAERPAGGVAKGDTVVLRKVGRTVILEEPARVLEAGGPGDPIAVQNLRTGKQIRARVDGPGAATPLDEREVKSGGRGD